MERVDLGHCLGVIHRRQASSRLVLLPGAWYPTQAPLLWFAREVALARGLGVLEVRDELAAATDDPFAWARDRAEQALDFEPSPRLLVVGKSLASAAAGTVADRRLAALWLTPLLDRETVLDGLARASAPTILVGGTADPTWRPAALAHNPTLELIELEGLDHSLQVPGDPRASLEALRQVVGVMERFVNGLSAAAGS
jgi:hypothetical protein